MGSRALLVLGGVALCVSCGSSSGGGDDTRSSGGRRTAQGGSAGAVSGGTAQSDSAGADSGGTAGRAGSDVGQGGSNARAGKGGGGSTNGGAPASGASAGRAGSSGVAGNAGTVALGGEGGVENVEPVALPAPLVYFKEPIADPLDAVWGTGSGDVYAVGYGGTIAHDPGDGTFRRERASTSLELYSVWGSSPTDIWVGSAAGHLAHATGASSWTQRDLSYDISGPVYQVFGFAPDDMYLATGSLFHGTLNSRWTKVSGAPAANSLWGSAPDDLYVVATVSLDQPNVFHSDGSGKWRSQASTGEYMSRVFGLDAHHVYALGSHSVWFSAGDGTWRSVLTLPGEQPISVWGEGGLLYVGSQAGKLYVTNGEAWSEGQAISSPAAPRITGIWGTSSDNLYLATSNGLYHGTPDGAPPDYPGVAGSGGTDGAGPFSTDPSDFGGESRCPSSAVLCEDFESGDLGDWSVLGSDISVDQQHAARGDSALHVHNAAAFGGGLVESWAAFPQPYDRFWLRFFAYFDALPSDIGPWSIAIVSDAVPAVGGLRLGGYSDGAGSNVLEYSLETPFVSLRDSGSDAELPTGAWVCLEWYIDGLSDEARVYWDNVERPALHATPALMSTIDSGKYSTPEIDYLQLGWAATLSTPLDLWIDAVAVGPERIGCEH